MWVKDTQRDCPEGVGGRAKAQLPRERSAKLSSLSFFFFSFYLPLSFSLSYCKERAAPVPQVGGLEWGVLE